MMQTRDLTREVVEHEINAAADMVASVAHFDEQISDVVNLVVNVALHRLFTDPDAELDDVIEACYDESPETVRGWVS